MGMMRTTPASGLSVLSPKILPTSALIALTSVLCRVNRPIDMPLNQSTSNRAMVSSIC